MARSSWRERHHQWSSSPQPVQAPRHSDRLATTFTPATQQRCASFFFLPPTRLTSMTVAWGDSTSGRSGPIRRGRITCALTIIHWRRYGRIGPWPSALCCCIPFCRGSLGRIALPFGVEARPRCLYTRMVETGTKACCCIPFCRGSLGRIASPFWGRSSSRRLYTRMVEAGYALRSPTLSRQSRTDCIPLLG